MGAEFWVFGLSWNLSHSSNIVGWQANARRTNQLRSIKKWNLYKELLATRMYDDSNFEDKEVNQQEKWLKQQMNKVGHEITSSKSVHKQREKRPMEIRKLELDTRVAWRDYFSQRSNRSEAENIVIKQVWQKLKRKLTAKQIQRKITIKRKTRSLMKSKFIWSETRNSNLFYILA